MTEEKPFQTKKQVYKLLLYLLLSLFPLILIHETGHYLVADYYDLNPSYHFFEQNHISYIQSDVPHTLEVSRQVALAGPFTGLVVIFLCSLYLFYHISDIYTFWTTYAICIILYSTMVLILSYYPLYQPYGSDLWQVIYLGG